MWQRITRQKYYGEVNDGTPVMVLDNTEWYLALLKDRATYYFMISENGDIRYNGNIPKFSEFFFPNGYDILLAKLFTEKDKEEQDKARRNKLLYKIKRVFR